jgi:hypothetical protein
MLIKKNVPLLQNARIQKYLYNSEFSFLIILLKFSIRELRNEKKVELILISHFIFIIFNFKKSDFGMAGMSTDTLETMKIQIHLRSWSLTIIKKL